MKLTKQLEAEILNLYNEYWDAYLKGDIKTSTSFYDSNISVFGTAKAEIFSNKKTAVKFYKATADQMTGKAEMRKRKIVIKPAGNTIIVNEQFDLYVLAEKEWIFYGNVRLTSIFEQKGTAWKIILHHASFPDSRTEAGEQIATEKIKKENLQLKEAVQRRTVELEEKNKELEVEAALERVRTVAMAMKKADDMLSICKTITQQLQKLGVKEIRNVQTAIIKEEKGTYINYEFYAKHNKQFTTEVSYINHPMSKAFVKKMLDGPNEFFKRSLTSQKTKEWYAFQKTTNQFADSFLLKASSLNYYWYSLGPVALGISTYAPLSKEEQDLFVRFRNVFELSYRRFLDIEQAAAQAREAEIELALERVRARTMAMQKSDELFDVAHLLNQQFKSLGETTLQMTIGIANESEKLFDTSVTDWSGKGKSVFTTYKIPFAEPSLFKEIYNGWKKKLTSVVIQLRGERLKKWVAYRNKLSGVKVSADKPRIITTAFFSKGFIAFSNHETSSPASVHLLERFASVFNQTYTRFLDLQKAEAQAREAQIEVALERVRAAAMAMRNSAELGSIIYKVYGELTKLDAKLDRCFIMIVHPENKGITWWLAGKEGLLAENGFFIQMNQQPSHLMYLDHWKKRKKKWQYLFEGKEKRDCDKFLFSKTELSKLPGFIQKDMAGVKSIHLSGSSDQFGSLVTGSFEPLPEEQQEIINRFTIAFNQAYIRFLDLQKAEAQARENQIQLALERVRARTMAMQRSDELPETSHILFEQMKELGEPVEQLTIGIVNEENKVIEISATLHGDTLKKIYNHSTDEPYMMAKVYKAWKQQQKTLAVELSGSELNAYNRYRNKLTNSGMFPTNLGKKQRRIVYAAFFSKGMLALGSNEPRPPQSLQLLERFASVFDLTYRRFLDLQKAEAQAREAQIEAALERVRSRSIGMQKSDELRDVIKVVYDQLVHLNIKLDHAGFVVDYQPKKDWTFWIADEQDIPSKITHPYFESVWATQYNNAKEKGEELFVTYLNFEEKNKFYNQLLSYIPDLPLASKEFYLNCPALAATTVLLDNVGLYIENFEGIPYSDEHNNILKRFGKVFEQTYTRFLDLQKAEAQAKEAQIEAALERVRSKTMAMHNSNDVGETAAVMEDELKKLGIDTLRCGIGIMHEPGDMELWTISKNEDNKPDIIIGWLDMHIHPLLKGAFESWRNKNEFYSYDLKDEDLLSYYSAINNYPGYPIRYDVATLPKQIHHNEFYFPEGILFAFSLQQLMNEQRKIFKRFALVFGQTYRRYLDLKKAEAQAREAQIEASLEKVRSRSLAMQKPGELLEVAELLRKEMGQLGVEELETSSIYIVDKEKEQAECWYAIKDIREEHTKLVSDEIMITFNTTWVGTEMWKFYKSKKADISIVMKGENRKEWINYCAGVSNVLQGYYGNEIPDRSYHLVKFSGGYMGAASPGDISAESWDLLRRAASVFSLAYTRFNDLQIAEANARQAEQDLIAIKEAKQKAEAALTELQVTQKQLIQSEKMASLGELTAGIAHEIQNPLNFVNNFSEVSAELVKEMIEEVDKGNTDEVKFIADDLIGNLEKINHHGKRAADIVKGMLQHSRSGSSAKEPTDINALADEYLRLAYHGLRAKDKSFNASMKTDFDVTIGNINIIPQDIGRVILNLITNAFYAVNERSKQNIAGYEPTVEVNTKKDGNKVLITVKDNGNGIPQKVLDKIFQPFFTTKPTGQGTGLGLSLSYDIVKVHGGEITVDTKEGTGTTFQIQLPNNTI